MPLGRGGTAGVAPKRADINDVLPHEADVAQLNVRHARELGHRSARGAGASRPSERALESGR